MSEQKNSVEIINQIRRENLIYYLTNNLQNCKNDEEKNIIREKLKTLQNEESNTNVLSKINELHLSTYENQFKRRWHRLNDDQKFEVIEKYYSTKPDTCRDEKNKIIEMIKDGTLKNKNVVYDDKNGCIENIILK